MRRLAASLLLLFLVARVLLSTLPVFVCHEMGGMHVLEPCCTADELSADQTSLVSARCCEQEAQAKLDIQLTPQSSLDIALEATALLEVLPALLPPEPASLAKSVCTRAGAPPTGPPPPLRQVLRI